MSHPKKIALHMKSPMSHLVEQKLWLEIYDEFLLLNLTHECNSKLRNMRRKVMVSLGNHEISSHFARARL